MSDFEKVGILCGSYKPFHLGHWNLMKKASEENNKVILLVSLKDRDNILGSDMALIWKNYILPHLPNNVNPVFIDGSPLTRLFKILRLREADTSSNYQFFIYSTPEDINLKFNNDLLTQICPKLLGTEILNLVPVKRSDTCDISGSQMREFISNCDYKAFSKNMPIEFDNQAIFDILASV